MPSETDNLIDQVVSAASRHGHDSIIALSGVAGTGKSYIAFRSALSIAGHNWFVKQIQFHQSFSYEDFIEGYRPTAAGGFEAQAGILLDWNARALADPGNRYVLLIEELTRANVSAVLGELLTYIEHRGRHFQTPCSRKRIRLSENLVILATYNPQDRSALELDDAIIRRLRIVCCPPSVEMLREMLLSSTPPLDAADLDGLVALFETCQKKYPDTFSDLMPFGHGLFHGVTSKKDLADLWEHRIRHLIRRPQAPPHPFCEDIESLYVWKAIGSAP